MMNRLFSPGSANTAAAGSATYDDTFDLFAEMPTQEIDVPDYVTEVPNDIGRQEVVGLTLAERLKFLREEEEIKGRGLADDLVDSVGKAFDSIFLAPIRLIFANLGFLVTGAFVLLVVAFGANWIISTVMGNFQGSMF